MNDWDNQVDKCTLFYLTVSIISVILVLPSTGSVKSTKSHNIVWTNSRSGKSY